MKSMSMLPHVPLLLCRAFCHYRRLFTGDSTKREARTLNDESKEIREILSSQVRVWQTAFSRQLLGSTLSGVLLGQDTILAAKDK